MAKAKLEILNIKEVTGDLEKLKGTIPKAAIALHREHEEIMTTAKLRTPVDTGTLRASGHVKPVSIEKSAIVSIGGFGGAAKEYAIYVHERIVSRSGKPVFHKVGRAKFYESAILDAVPELTTRLANRIKGML